MTQLTQSLIPRQLSQRQVRFHVNWVNAERDSTSTESTRNDKIFVNVGIFCVVSVAVESHSVLTQLTWSLTLHWLSWRRVWFHVDSVWERWIKPKQAYISSSGTFKGIVFIKINNEMFKWGPYQPENVNRFYIAWSKKLNLCSLSQRRVTNNLNISANSILYSKRIQGINQGTKLVLLMKKKNRNKKSRASVPLISLNIF